MTADAAELFAAACRGERRALARLLSVVERGGDPARQLGELAAPQAAEAADSAHTVGITGAPGSGKSTLTGAVVEHVRRGGDTVAVLAVDPSSPFTGGAILGDRVRMNDHANDDGVFIRSMATRGHLGGLALAAPEAVRLFIATGHPLVLVETVGVGQVEVEIAGWADTTVVVVNPGWGDSVQANKAGLLEIADVFVINKADRDGAGQTRADLRQMLEFSADRDDRAAWRPPIVDAVATEGRGIDELWDAVVGHRAWAVETGELERRRARRAAEELRQVIIRLLELRAQERCGGERWDALVADVVAGRRDPWSAARTMLEE